MPQGLASTSTIREDQIEGAGGLHLCVRSWRPERQARAVVAIVPGFNSHGGYYMWVGEQLNARGLAAFSIDLRGRGKSDGERFYVEKFADYLSDVDTLVQLAKSREPGLQVFLLGHSAGGVVSCMYTLEHQAELAGFICEDFAFQVPTPDFVLAVMKGISHLAPHAHVLRLKNADFSRDPRVVLQMDNDPLIANETQPTKTIAEMARADERLKKSFPQITLPVLIMHGTEDRITRPSGSQLFYDTVGSRDKTLNLYEGHYHDPLNDVGREQVMADILNWIDARVTAVRS